MSAIADTLHMYGSASHLIHADLAALNLMAERKLRDADELVILSATPLCRAKYPQRSISNSL